MRGGGVQPPQRGYEIAEAIKDSNERIAGIKLGDSSASGLEKLNVACHRCPRRGRYSVDRLVKAHSDGMLLSKIGRGAIRRVPEPQRRQLLQALRRLLP